jgi:hypothetical protein
MASIGPHYEQFPKLDCFFFPFQDAQHQNETEHCFYSYEEEDKKRRSFHSNYGMNQAIGSTQLWVY